MFQSSPRPVGRVQPAGRTRNGSIPNVSILTRPVGRVQPAGRTRNGSIPNVSILTRPVGRVQHAAEKIRLTRDGFQSSPGPVGRVQHAASSSPAQGNACFNPHPARGPSATALQRREVGVAGVSILTRPVGRVQRPSARDTKTRPSWSFNPHPARGPSATGPRAAGYRCRRCFNPHPARGPSATCMAASRSA